MPSHTSANPLSTQEKRFWALMGECDRILQEEAHAIIEQNIDHIHSLHEKKISILHAIEGLEGLIQKNGLDKNDKHIRFQALTNQQNENLTAFKQLQQDLQTEHHSLKKTHNRYQSIGKTYYTSKEAVSREFYA